MMTMSKFKVGDRVKISKDSKYYGRNEANPADMVGEVASTGLDVVVQWSNGIENDYRESDLEHAKTKSQRIAELEARVAELEARVAELEARVAELEARVAELEARVAELEGKRASKSEHALDAAAYLKPFTTKLTGKIYDENYRGKSFAVTAHGTVVEGAALQDLIEQGVEFYDLESAELFIKQRAIRHCLDGFCRKLCEGHKLYLTYLHWDVNDKDVTSVSWAATDYKIPPGAYCLDKIRRGFSHEELRLALGGEL